MQIINVNLRVTPWFLQGFVRWLLSRSFPFDSAKQLIVPELDSLYFLTRCPLCIEISKSRFRLMGVESLGFGLMLIVPDLLVRFLSSFELSNLFKFLTVFDCGCFLFCRYCCFYVILSSIWLIKMTWFCASSTLSIYKQSNLFSSLLPCSFTISHSLNRLPLHGNVPLAVVCFINYTKRQALRHDRPTRWP